MVCLVYSGDVLNALWSRLKGYKLFVFFEKNRKFWVFWPLMKFHLKNEKVLKKLDQNRFLTSRPKKSKFGKMNELNQKTILLNPF